MFSFPVEDIKNKFKNLRTTFQRQYKMVKASKVCNPDDEFVPQWKHYHQLMFLQGCWDQDDAAACDPPLSPLAAPQEEGQAVLASPGLIISFLPTPSTSSSCVPSSVMIKCYWTEERERALISFYSGKDLLIKAATNTEQNPRTSNLFLCDVSTEHNCLWNKKSENHNNRQLRLRLLEALRSQLSDPTVSFSGERLRPLHRVTVSITFSLLEAAIFHLKHIKHCICRLM